MKKHIFIGVDGGGTKCKIRIEDERGNVLGKAIGGPANIRFSVLKAWETIYQGIDEILKPLNISILDPQIHFHAGFGLAGCEVAEDRQQFLSQPHPFKSLELVSDAHTACVAAHDSNDGAIIIVGTGVVGYQICQGKVSRVAGWGFPHDDDGGGAWLGLEAARLTFHAVDGRIAKTPLLEEIFENFNNNITEMTTWAIRGKSTEFATLAPLVIKHMATDPNAQALMRRAGDAITLVGDTLEKLHDNKSPLPCSLFGGIAPHVEPFLGENLRARIVPRKDDACYGAIIMMKKKVMVPA